MVHRIGCHSKAGGEDTNLGVRARADREAIAKKRPVRLVGTGCWARYKAPKLMSINPESPRS